MYAMQTLVFRKRYNSQQKKNYFPSSKFGKRYVSFLKSLLEEIKRHKLRDKLFLYKKMPSQRCQFSLIITYTIPSKSQMGFLLLICLVFGGARIVWNVHGKQKAMNHQAILIIITEV